MTRNCGKILQQGGQTGKDIALIDFLQQAAGPKLLTVFVVNAAQIQVAPNDLAGVVDCGTYRDMGGLDQFQMLQCQGNHGRKDTGLKALAAKHSCRLGVSAEYTKTLECLRRRNAALQSALVAVVALDGYFGKSFHAGGR